MQMTSDIDKEVRTVPNNYPYIVMALGDQALQYFVVGERLVLCKSDNFIESLFDLLCVYFTYNIQYPKSLSAVLLFVQHYILGIKDSQRIPPALIRVVSSFS